VIVTGVPRGAHLPGQWVPPQTTASAERPALPSEKPAGSGVSPSPPQPTSTYVHVTVSNGSEEDPGQIAEGWYTIEDGLLVLRDRDDRLITSRGLLKNEDPAVLARILLRERAPNDFQGKIIYPKLGFA
jgi:hypothetical protein